MNTNRLLILLVALALCLPCGAAKLGDPAAKLDIAEWVKGKPVDLAKLKGKKIAVIEFWATWCPPCRTSIPHLSEMQKKYKKNVVFIGVTREKSEVVKPFVEKLGGAMDYTVAIDREDKTNKGYMTAYKQGGIPHAFIVDREGKMVFDAHPMAGEFETALKAVIAGEFDMDIVLAQREKEQALKKQYAAYFDLASKGQDQSGADAIGAELLDAFAKSSSKLNQFAWTIATGKGIKYRDHDLALRAAKRACELTQFEDAAILDTYARVLYELKRLDEAVKYQEKALELAPEGNARAQFDKALEQYRAAQ